ncbi:MAG TPA: hypothetical protein VH518_19385 [Tepidisphaeraceae bacterium]|jgi:hypothetical protein
MKHTLLLVSCLSLGLGAAAGCGGKVTTHAGPAPQSGFAGSSSGFSNTDSQPTLKGPAVDNYNKGFVDGVNASAFFNKGQPLTDQQVDRLIEIGRRQGDPTGLLALNGYPEGYRTGAKHDRNPYEKQMTPEQVAQVRKAQGLPPEPVQQAKPEPATRPQEAPALSKKAEKKQLREERKEARKSKKDTAEASSRD